LRSCCSRIGGQSRIRPGAMSPGSLCCRVTWRCSGCKFCFAESVPPSRTSRFLLSRTSHRRPGAARLYLPAIAEDRVTADCVLTPDELNAAFAPMNTARPAVHHTPTVKCSTASARERMAFAAASRVAPRSFPSRTEVGHEGGLIAYGFRVFPHFSLLSVSRLRGQDSARQQTRTCR